MFSLITPYIKIIKIVGILSICGLILFVVHIINGWHNDSLKLIVITEQLQSEIACTVPSKCASDAVVKAEESIKAVQAAQDAAKHDRDEREYKDKANEQEAANRNTESLNNLKRQLEQYRINLTEHSSIQCKQVLDMVIPCDIQ